MSKLFEGSSIEEWILENKHSELFSEINITKQAVIKQAIYATIRQDLELLMLEISDGDYYIPALFEANMIREKFGISEIGSVECTKLVSKVIDINKYMVSACRKEDTVWPYVIVLDFQISLDIDNGTINTVKNICDNEKVIPWINRIMPYIENNNRSISSYFQFQILEETYGDFRTIEKALGYFFAKMYRAHESIENGGAPLNVMLIQQSVHKARENDKSVNTTAIVNSEKTTMTSEQQNRALTSSKPVETQPNSLISTLSEFQETPKANNNDIQTSSARDKASTIDLDEADTAKQAPKASDTSPNNLLSKRLDDELHGVLVAPPHTLTPANSASSQSQMANKLNRKEKTAIEKTGIASPPSNESENQSQPTNTDGLQPNNPYFVHLLCTSSDEEEEAEEDAYMSPDDENQLNEARIALVNTSPKVAATSNSETRSSKEGEAITSHTEPPLNRNTKKMNSPTLQDTNTSQSTVVDSEPKSSQDASATNSQTTYSKSIKRSLPFSHECASTKKQRKLEVSGNKAEPKATESESTTVSEPTAVPEPMIVREAVAVPELSTIQEPIIAPETVTLQESTAVSRTMTTAMLETTPTRRMTMEEYKQMIQDKFDAMTVIPDEECVIPLPTSTSTLVETVIEKENTPQESLEELSIISSPVHQENEETTDITKASRAINTSKTRSMYSRLRSILFFEQYRHIHCK